MSEKGRKKGEGFFFFFTHQQAVVFRFQMPLPAHRKHCPCVSHHSMKSPLPSGGKNEAIWQELLSALSRHPLPAQGSAERITRASSNSLPHPTLSEATSVVLKGPSASRHQALHLRRRCIILLATLGAGGGAAHSRHSKLFAGWMGK